MFTLTFSISNVALKLAIVVVTCASVVKFTVDFWSQSFWVFALLRNVRSTCDVLRELGRGGLITKCVCVARGSFGWAHTGCITRRAHALRHALRPCTAFAHLLPGRSS